VNIAFRLASGVLAAAVLPAAAQPSETVIRTPARVAWLTVATARPLAVTLGVDHKMRVLSLPDGAEQRVIDLSADPVDVFSVSPDGRFALLGDHTGSVRVWATSTGLMQFERKLPHYPGIARFSHDGATLAIAAQGDPVELVDAATGARKQTLGRAIGGTAAVAFSRDDRYVATADGDTAVRVYAANTGTRISENLDSTMTPLAVDFTADGRTVVAAGGDKVLLFIDTATGRTTRRSARLPQPPAVLEVSPDGAWIATVLMKAENMMEAEHVIVTPIASGPPAVEWMPPRLPVGGGWTSDGRLLIAIALPDSLQLSYFQVPSTQPRLM
jgi:tricorn protease-like protein